VTGSLDVDLIILDDRVAQELVTRLIHPLARTVLVRAAQVDLDIFADVDRGDALVTHLFQGVLDGLALGIDHGLFRSDDDFRFHAWAGCPA